MKICTTCSSEFRYGTGKTCANCSFKIEQSRKYRTRCCDCHKVIFRIFKHESSRCIKCNKNWFTNYLKKYRQKERLLANFRQNFSIEKHQKTIHTTYQQLLDRF